VVFRNVPRKSAPVGVVYLLKANRAARPCLRGSRAQTVRTDPCPVRCALPAEASLPEVQRRHCPCGRDQSPVGRRSDRPAREAGRQRREAPSIVGFSELRLTAAGSSCSPRLAGSAELERELVSTLSASELAGLQKGLTKLLATPRFTTRIPPRDACRQRRRARAPPSAQPGPQKRYAGCGRDNAEGACGDARHCIATP